MNHPPDTSEFQLGRQARKLFEEQQFDAASKALGLLAENVPGNPYVHMDFAAVLQRCGRLRDSTTQLLKAASSPSPSPGFSIQLARRLWTEGETVAARSCLDMLEMVPDLPAQLLAEQAHLRWMMREVPAARRMIDRAIAAGADNPQDHHLQAMLMQFAGEFDEASGVLVACLKRWPAFGNAALVQANMRRQTQESHHLDFLRWQLARLPAGSKAPAQLANRAAFEAALFKELDDLGMHDEAWLALERCNALMHRVKPYDANGESALVDAVIKASNSLSRPSVASGPDADGAQPIFIVGMPRSGTTLLDRMLSSHSEIISAGEITDFVRQLRWVTDTAPEGIQGRLRAVERSPGVDLSELGERYLSQTRWLAQGRRYFVDKLPANIWMAAHIHHALPQARILHMARDPMEVCFSNLGIMFGNASAYSYDQHALAHYYGQYKKLCQHWRNLMPGAILDVSYSDLVHSPGTTLRKVLEHCGLAVEDACLQPEKNAAPVATPSSVQVREPIHTRGFDRWRHYAQHLGTLIEATRGIEIGRQG